MGGTSSELGWLSLDFRRKPYSPVRRSWSNLAICMFGSKKCGMCSCGLDIMRNLVYRLSWGGYHWIFVVCCTCLRDASQVWLAWRRSQKHDLGEIYLPFPTSCRECRWRQQRSLGVVPVDCRERSRLAQSGSIIRPRCFLIREHIMTISQA